MKKIISTILFLALIDLLAAGSANGQVGTGWKPAGLDFVVISHSGELNRPDLQAFVNNTRNPSLFGFQPESIRHISNEAEMEAGGLMVRFRFTNPDHPNYDYWAGIGNVFSQISLFSFYPTETDSLKLDLLSQTTYFMLAGGVNKHYHFLRRFRFTIGVQSQIGLNVAGRIQQEFSIRPEDHPDSGFQESETWRLFSNDGPYYSTGLLAGLRARLFSRTYLSWEVSPSYWISRIDGSTVNGFLGGGSIGIEIRFKP